MAEFQLVGVGTHGQRNQLVAKADAEHRLFANQLLHFLNDLRHVLRVARAVGQENAVRIHGQHFLRRGMGRHNRQVAAQVVEGIEDVLLDAEIHYHHVRAVIFHLVNLRRSNLLHHFLLDWHSKQLLNLHLGSILRHDDALHAAHGTDFAGNGTGIHVVQARHALTGKEIRQLALQLPVAALIAQLADDEAVDKGLPGLHELLSHAVVAYQRKGQGDNLAAIGRVRQNLLIAGHACIKYYLAGSLDIIQ